MLIVSHIRFGVADQFVGAYHGNAWIRGYGKNIR